jgi:hypothetical protein
MSQKTAVISTLISDRRLCLSCLSTNTMMTAEAVESAIEVLGRALVIHRHGDKCCDECGTRTTVFILEPP